jgi:putative ABC transport system permease protein
MSSLWIDIRYALRMLVKAPRLTAILLITLALGIGASTTIFSVVNSVVLAPLPYQQPDALVRAYIEITGKKGMPRLGLSVPGYLGLARSCRSCAAVGAWTRGSASLASGDRAVRVKATFASHTLLPLLGVRPVLGRWFDEREDQPGPPQVIVLGYDVWQRVFAADRSIVGKQIHMDAQPVTVIGVMPPGFSFPEHEEVWVPARFDPTQPYAAASFNLAAVIRVAPGASITSVRDELDGSAKGWTDELNAIGSTIGFPPMVIHAQVVAFQADLVGSLSTTLWLLQAAVLFVLLISVVNVANLLLARSETRTREVAIRHALGANRRRLLRQFITESLILGLLGGGLGILVAMWALDGVTRMVPREAPRVDEIALDAPAVVFAVACSIAAALVFGLAPILHARRTDIHGALKDGSPRMTGNKARLRVRRALVIGELALAVVLVVGCCAMVRSFLRLQRVEPGFAPDHLLTFGIELPKQSYPGDTVAAYWHRLHDRMQALPGVRSAGLLSALPPKTETSTNGITFPGRTAGAPDEPDWLTDYIQLADDHALETLGARIVRGRAFAAGDGPNAPTVAMVNEAFAAKFFRGRDPIGQRIKMPFAKFVEMTVVGVVGDVKRAGLDQPTGAELILPLWQCPAMWPEPDWERQMYTVLRTTGDPADLIPAVQRAAAELDPGLPVFAIRTMDDVMWEAVARPRFLLFLLSSFAGIALLLAAVGIYGVMAHTVAQRTHEIGLRVALGARPAQVRAMVLRQAATLVATGVGVGLAAAIALSMILGAALRDLFYGEPLAQPLVLAAVALAVTATALLATWIPARRATQVQPTVALRAE